VCWYIVIYFLFGITFLHVIYMNYDVVRFDILLVILSVTFYLYLEYFLMDCKVG